MNLADDYRVWTTQMIVDRLKIEESGGVKNGHMLIPICQPVQFTTGGGWAGKDATVDPYLLGLLLGDGCMTERLIKYTHGSLVRIASSDKEIVNYIASLGLDIRECNSGNQCNYSICDKGLVSSLVALKVAHGAKEKFVPYPYKFGTIETRRAILQGLMDTDGTIDKRGHCSFASISKQLAEDVKFLVSSLGGLATISRNKAGYKKDGVYIKCQDVYNVYIKINNSEQLFRLPRKRERAHKYNGGVSELARRIVKAEYVGKKECCCIAVDNTNSLFMIEDFIVTHNSKSFSLVMEGLKDIKEPNFSGLIVRNERDDLTQIIDYSLQMYSQYGTFNRSKDDRTWNFTAGGKLRFSYYNDAFEDFVKRFQGKQYNYIGIDEITHIPYPKFKYLVTCNRNGIGLRNRIWGTCNPDPDSWVRKFIDWWIGPDGFPIPERDCVVRYCFMDGDSPDTIYWGDTPDEVYEQCKDIIDGLWKEAYAQLGYDKKRMFVKSVTFCRAGLEENVKLMLSDPNYLANLAQQSDEQRSRDLEGNWNFKSSGEDMIKLLDMETFFDRPKVAEGRRCASCDIAFEGGDSLVMWLWEGFHIKDIYVCRNDSKSAMRNVKGKLQEWGVLEENFVYDLNGLGQSFKGFFPHAKPFNNIAGVDPRFKGMYHDLKSQCAYLFAHKLIDGEMSIEPRLLTMRFSGKGFTNAPLRQILLKERKAIRPEDDSSDKGFTLIKKSAMKKLVGHSPDYIEALLMRFLFETNKGMRNNAKGMPIYQKAKSIRFL